MVSFTDSKTELNLFIQHSTKIGNSRTLHVQNHFLVHFFALTALRSCPCMGGRRGGYGEGFCCGKREKNESSSLVFFSLPSPSVFTGYDITFLWQGVTLVSCPWYLGGKEGS